MGYVACFLSGDISNHQDSQVKGKQAIMFSPQDSANSNIVFFFLQVVYQCWQRHDIKGALSAMEKMADTAVSVSFLCPILKLDIYLCNTMWFLSDA